jgi:hypothetical protein
MAMPASLSQLEQADAANDRLIRGVLLAALRNRTLEGHTPSVQIVQDYQGAIKRMHPPVNLGHLRALAMNTGTASVDEVGAGLGKAASDIIERGKGMLEDLRQRGIVGWCMFRSPDVAAFNYGRTEIADTVLDKCEQSTSHIVGRSANTETISERRSIRTTVDRQTTLQVHTHFLLRPRFQPFPAEDVAKPDFVEQLIAVVPPWLRPTACVITADQYRKTVHTTLLDRRTETLTEVKTRTYRRARPDRRRWLDPCITVFGNRYVIAGWIPEENATRWL